MTTRFDQEPAAAPAGLQPDSPDAEALATDMVTLDVELVKDSQGLGVTIAGYTCEREDLSGIFVKSVTEGSAAHRSGKVAVNDQIIEVDGRSIQVHIPLEITSIIFKFFCKGIPFRKLGSDP